MPAQTHRRGALLASSVENCHSNLGTYVVDLVHLKAPLPHGRHLHLFMFFAIVSFGLVSVGVFRVNVELDPGVQDAEGSLTNPALRRNEMVLEASTLVATLTESNGNVTRQSELPALEPSLDGSTEVAKESSSLSAVHDDGFVQGASASTGASVADPPPTSPPVELAVMAMYSYHPTFPPTQSPAYCAEERDSGMIQRLQTGMQRFCQPTDAQQQQQQPDVTQIRHFAYTPADLKATVFSNLELDLRQVEIAAPIANLTLDGGNHDPRFRFHQQLIHCECEQVRQELLPMMNHATSNKPIEFWTSIFAQQNDPLELSSHCLQDSTQQPVGDRSQISVIDGTRQVPSPVDFHENVVLIARKDDHNPFFQISATLNAWILLQVVGWEMTTTRLVLLDAGYDTPTDELQHRLLAPDHELVRGTSLHGQRVHFDQVLVAPFETTGPMMAHLNDDEPCYRNDLILRFRQEAMAKFAVSMAKADTSAKCLVTVLSRRVYHGRNVQRKWLNEQEILNEMRAQYGVGASDDATGSVGCVFQSVDFVELNITTQMEIIRDSDVVIGMHGAGLVNVLWTRPGTVVIEIFPRNRRRWGYRNLCQFVGCDWHEFRGGVDTGNGDNASDKTVAWHEWSKFFEPLIQRVASANHQLLPSPTPTSDPLAVLNHLSAYPST